MEGRSQVFLRADTVDINRLDEQLGRHLDRVWAMENHDKGKKLERITTAKEDWEIDARKLTVKEVIARGAFGIVHRGIYGGKDVAVKVLDWGDGQKTEAHTELLNSLFRQEIAIWHKLDHPNVAKFIGATMGSSESIIHSTPNEACIVMEYLPLGTLKSYLIKNQKRKLAFKIVVRLALDLARGVSYLHSRNVVHRDLKTENMLLDKNHTVKITDFGVARLQAAIPTEMTGNTGTLGYMAPEVLENKPYNWKCDVYSFGICLWEIYCCDMSFPNIRFSDLSSVVYKNMRPEIPTCCPSSLAEVMRRCWDADPKKRPEMKEVVTMLEAIDTSKGKGMTPLCEPEPQGCFCFCRR